MKDKIKIGGVPEHFNYLFQLAQEEGLYDKYNVEVEFIIQKCGTGAMIKALKNNDLDVIIALTEGLTADICNGSDLKIFGTYVNSPLCWAASVGKNSSLNKISDLKGKCFGVSRYGSGSHLMAYVLAMQNNWNLKQDLKFDVIGDFEKLRNSVNNNTADVFLWETFTTKPYHDSKEVKRIGDIVTPWPAFMMASLKDTLDKKKNILDRVFKAVNEAAVLFKNNKNMPSIIAEKYNLKKEDAEQWYNDVNIIAEKKVSKSSLDITINTLKNTGLIDKDNTIKPEFIIYQDLCELI